MPIHSKLAVIKIPEDDGTFYSYLTKNNGDVTSEITRIPTDRLVYLQLKDHFPYKGKFQLVLYTYKFNGKDSYERIGEYKYTLTT